MDLFPKMASDRRLAIERALGQTISRLEKGAVRDVCSFATLGGGHRWRGLFAFGVAFAVRERNVKEEAVVPSACGLELVHSASLMLDDSPSMDAAEMRRGKPCAHRVFPLWAVELGSVFLLSLAQRVLLSNSWVPPERRIAAADELAKAVQLMIYGQEQDLSGHLPDKGWASLRDCYACKTGALWGAAAKMAALTCGCDFDTSDRFYDCGLNTGICYQILDDIGDATSTLEAMGKKPKSDTAKITSVTLHGIEGALRLSKEFRGKALALIKKDGKKADFLRFLIDRMSSDGNPLCGK